MEYQQYIYVKGRTEFAINKSEFTTRSDKKLFGQILQIAASDESQRTHIILVGSWEEK